MAEDKNCGTKVELGRGAEADRRAVVDLDSRARAGLDSGAEVGLDHEALEYLDHGAVEDLGHEAVAQHAKQGAHMEQKTTRSEAAEQEITKADKNTDGAGNHHGRSGRTGTESIDRLTMASAATCG